MEDPNDPNREESRKRKLLQKSFPQQSEEENITDSIEDPQIDPAPASVPDVVNTVAVEEDLCRPIYSCAMKRQEFVKLVSTVITETNHQHDLKTQRELAALQAQNDDSDDEPPPRRPRLIDYPITVRPAPAVSCASGIISTVDLQETISERQEYIQGLAASSICHISVPGPSNINPGAHDDDNHPPKRQCTSVSNVRAEIANLNEQEDLTSNLDVLQNISSTQFPNCMAPHTVTSVDLDLIPLPGTSTSTVNAISPINIPSFVHSRSVNLPSTRNINIPVVLPRSPRPMVLARMRNRHGKCTIYPINIFDFDSSDESDDAISVFGEEDSIPRGTRPRTRQEHLLESSDDEDYLQMINNVQNCSIAGNEARGDSQPSNRGTQQNSAVRTLRTPNPPSWRIHRKAMPEVRISWNAKFTNDEQRNFSGSKIFPSTTRSNWHEGESLFGNCPICKKVLRASAALSSTFCGHLFCTECLKRAIAINDKICPKCHKPLLPGELYHPVYF